MVPLVRVGDAFHARVLAARLGSEGIVTQLRGGIDTPYPTGHVEVLVSEDDLDDARQLLLADDLEAALEPAADRSTAPRDRRWLVVVGVALLALLVIADVIVVATR